MQVQVRSIARSPEETASWPTATDICPRCGEPFGTRKMVRDNGTVVHRTCPALLRREPENAMPVRIHPVGNRPVLDARRFGVVYTLDGTPLSRPAEADGWEIVPGLTFTCLFDWQRCEGYRGFTSHRP